MNCVVDNEGHSWNTYHLQNLEQIHFSFCLLLESGGTTVAVDYIAFKSVLINLKCSIFSGKKHKNNI